MRGAGEPRKAGQSARARMNHQTVLNLAIAVGAACAPPPASPAPPRSMAAALGLKSGLAILVQCGGTLAKACFLGWRQCRRPRIIGPPFLLKSVWEGIVHAFISALGRSRRCASGAPPGAWGRLRRRYGSSHLQGSMRGPMQGFATHRSIIFAIGQRARPACAARPEIYLSCIHA